MSFSFICLTRYTADSVMRIDCPRSMASRINQWNEKKLFWQETAYYVNMERATNRPSTVAMVI